MKRLLFFCILCLLAAPAVKAQKPTQPSWLSDAVFYQIYPSSFQDSDGDGYGDLKGIMSRLDYIKSIGVTAIWLNPIYVSGWTDGGYDVIDFYRVDKRFGTNSDLVELISQAHARGIKVVMDLVAGHSSDQNEWFLQSKEAPDLRYSDYYIWPSFKPEEPAQTGPMDYAALMNSSASLIRKFVATDAPRGPYYVKNFFDTQPALNFGFANPDPEHPWEQAVDAPGPMAMRREIKNIISFWMDKGVDGFRVDMAASLVKNDFDKSATIKLWKEDFTKWFDEEYPEGILIAEWFNPAQSVAAANFDLDFFCHDGQYNYSTLFFFGRRGFGPNAVQATPYFDKAGTGELKTWYDLYTYQYNAVQGHGYVCMPSGNHDFNRVCTEGRTSPEELKVAMTFFLTMPGVPFIYYGDEIGLKQNPAAPPTEGSGGRAGCRIPMLWNSDANAGFSTAPIDKIYIPQDPDPNRMTVEKAEADPNSLLHYVRALLRLRGQVKALGADASWRLVNSLDQPYPMVYERQLGDERCLVVLNPTGKTAQVTLPPSAEGIDRDPELIGGNYKKCTFRQSRRGDVISISALSAAIYKF
jgi:maltose alpha-D-glucosyltransferase/alpha-amylase